MVQPEIGHLYRPGDAVDLAEKMEAIVADPLEAAAMGARARNYALSHFGVATTVKRYESLVREGLKKRSSKTASWGTR